LQHLTLRLYLELLLSLQAEHLLQEGELPASIGPLMFQQILQVARPLEKAELLQSTGLFVSP
jgi:hypothetical protein